MIMSDYIKREDAIKANENYVPYQRLGEDRQLYFDRILKELPSADVVEVVRCKNCRHNGSFDTDCPFGWRDERFNLPDDIDFCSYGERKEQEHE